MLAKETPRADEVIALLPRAFLDGATPRPEARK
jgi:hypothetical protein